MTDVAAGSIATKGERTARIESSVSNPDAVAAAIAPDNTDEVTTWVEDGAVVTEIRRDSTASLEATVDDYVLNLDVALRIVQHATTETVRHTTNNRNERTTDSATHDTDHNDT